MRPRTFPIIALVLLMAATLFAQDPGEVQLFEEDETEIQIRAATKTDIPLSKVPGSVTVITNEMIRKTGARSIPEVVRLVAGLNIRWNPMVQTIDIRGFGSNPFSSRVLLMIDGVPFNAGDKGGFPQHPGLDFFVLQNVKRLEIVRGPGSALYGENAFWGVLNIVTLSGSDIQGVQVEIFGGDRSTGSVGATVGQKIGDDGSIFVSAKYLQSQFPMVFWAEEQDSKVNGSDVFLKGDYKGFQMSYYRHDDQVDGYREEVPVPGLPPGASFDSTPTVEQTVDIIAAKYDWAKSETWSVGGDFSFMRRYGSHCGGCHASAQSEDFQQSADHGGQTIGDVRFGYHGVSGQDFLFGVEARRVTQGDHIDELGLPAGSPVGEEVPASYNKVAFYFQDQMSFADDRVRVLAGFRYDGKNALFDDKLSPRVAGVFDVSSGLVLRAGWSTAFRFPNFSELYQNSWFFNVATDQFAIPLAVFTPNPGITPEQIETVEFGAEYRFNSATSVKADFHRSTLTDYIVLAYLGAPPPTPVGVRFENHPDDVNLWGTELEFRFRASPKLNGFVNWAYQNQEQNGNQLDSAGNLIEFTYAPTHKVNVATYYGPFSGFSGNVEYTWRDSYVGPEFWYQLENPAATVEPLPSYGLLNMRFNYDLPLGWNSHDRPWQLSFYAKNLFDEQPRETLIGLDSRLVGREFFFGTTFRF